MEIEIATKLNNIGAYNVKKEISNTKHNIESFLSDTVSIKDVEGFEKKINLDVNEHYSRLSNTSSYIASGVMKVEKFSTSKEYTMSGIIKIEDYGLNPDDYLVPYFDEHSGETFMISKMPSGQIHFPKETMDRLDECYPNTDELMFRIAEIHGNAKEINGVPVYVFTDLITGEKSMQILDDDYAKLKVSYTVGYLDNEYIFDFVKNFSQKNDMNSENFWDKLIGELVSTEKFININGDGYEIEKAKAIG